MLGDAHGNVVHLFERECSVQRRFQKIIEETPSPAARQPTRAADMRDRGRASRAPPAIAMRARSSSSMERDGSFYFLEMNTRLQVEHPVTEMITGIDLVARAARDRGGRARWGFAQDDVAQRGHAIECRIYAEDPARNFAPATGRILRLGLPQGPGIRVDGGVREGQQVTAAFDPMLAKLIAHGADRAEAIARARFALEHFVLLGCATNAAFLRSRCSRIRRFGRGEIHTGFLDAHPELAANPPIDSDTMLALLAAAALSQPPGARRGARGAGAARVDRRLAELRCIICSRSATTKSRPRCVRRRRGYALLHGGREYPVALRALEDGAVEIEVAGRISRARLARMGDDTFVRFDSMANAMRCAGSIPWSGSRRRAAAHWTTSRRRRCPAR